MFIEEWKADVTGENGERVSRTLELHLLDSLDLPEVYAFIKNTVEKLPRKEFFHLEDEGTMFKPFIEGGLIVGLYDEGRLIATRYVTFPRDGQHPLADQLELTDRERRGLVYLKSTVVDPAYRGNGLQRLLTEWMMAYVGLMGYDHFMATIHPENSYSAKNLLNLGLCLRGLEKMYPDKERPEGVWRLMLYGDRQQKQPAGDRVMVDPKEITGLQQLFADGFVGVGIEDGKIVFVKPA